MNKPIYSVLFLAAGCFAGVVNAEFGYGIGGAYSYKGSFQSGMIAGAPASDPGAATAGIDHFYDDGYNRVDSSGNFGGATTFWGYEEGSQYDPDGDGGNGTITMSSAYSTIRSGHSSGESDGIQPGVELYWQADLTQQPRWSIGFRAALGWQRIEVESSALYETTLTTVSDEYALGGVIPPGAPFDGSFLGGNAVLGDDPVRTVTAADGLPVQVRQSIDADLFTLNLGSALSIDLSERCTAVLSAGPTLAWIRSDYSHSSAITGRSGASDTDMLIGAHAAADLQYRTGERSGLFFGVGRTVLQNYSQQMDTREAELEFNDSYAFRLGLFVR